MCRVEKAGGPSRRVCGCSEGAVEGSRSVTTALCDVLVSGIHNVLLEVLDVLPYGHTLVVSFGWTV